MLITILADYGPYETAKHWIEAQTGFEQDVLHICVGLIVFVTVMLVSRRGPHHWLPLVWVFAAAIIGEILDIGEMRYIQRYPWDLIPWEHSWHDFWVTSVIPVIIFLFARIAHRFLRTE